MDFITKGLNWKGLISFDADMKYTAKRTKTPTQYLATGRDENGALQFKKVVEGSDVLTEKLENSSNKKSISKRRLTITGLLRRSMM